jgi:hypothetical protein
LVLGLLSRGARLLSDEFAVIEPGTRRIMPYHRSLHIRPPTPKLVPELAFLDASPQSDTAGRREWTLTPAELEQVFPAGWGNAAQLRHVLLMEHTPRGDAQPEIKTIPVAVAAMELLRGTWAASVDFSNGLRRMSELLDGVRCARLAAGALDATLERIVDWLETGHG